MDEEVSWYFHANRRYVWDKETIDEYIPVLKDVVYYIIKEHNDPKYLTGVCSPDIGLILIKGDKGEDWGVALYMSETKVSTWRRRSLLAEFKDLYEIHVGAGMASPFLGSDNSIRERFPPDRAEEIIRRKKLVRSFITLANKSVNRRRIISKRVRYLVLQRDKSTCQICGRRAPEVALHIDHIKPVSWEITWRPSDDPSEYQVLCEDCNLGKSDLSWMLNI
jgi:hypothetical protein